MVKPTGQKATVTEKTLGYPQSPRGTCKAIPPGTPAHTTRATGGCARAGQEPLLWFPQHWPVWGSPWAWSSGVRPWGGKGRGYWLDKGWSQGWGLDWPAGTWKVSRLLPLRTIEPWEGQPLTARIQTPEHQEYREWNRANILKKKTDWGTEREQTFSWVSSCTFLILYYVNALRIYSKWYNLWSTVTHKHTLKHATTFWSW